jgi:branched-chain amino acid transport system ATP-binding protein
MTSMQGDAAAPLLEVNHLTTYYGSIRALENVTCNVPEGSLVALVGANGAGKTTFLTTLSGLIAARAGSIRFQGTDIIDLPPQDRVRLGICQVPEGRQIWSPMSVADNIILGAYLRSDQATISEDVERCLSLFPILKEKFRDPAGTLSGGQQQMLAISRALMGKPRILLLDEPSMGLAPLLVREIFEVLRRLKEGGVTILLVEQNAMAALKLADLAYVLENGVIILSGTGADLLNDGAVQQAYLGM